MEKKIIPEDRKIFTTNFTVMPADCNYMGCIFGGHAMSHLDLAAASLCRRALHNTGLEAVTYKVLGITFKCAPYPGDIINIVASFIFVGNNSLVVKTTANCERKTNGKNELFAEGEFVFVTKDKEGFKPHNLELCQ